MKFERLTRDQFREGCLDRDNHKCVICGCPDNLSVHHIIERRLWDDGGYYFDNGASLCEPCHLNAERTDLSCEEIREATGIKYVVLPDGWYHDTTYTKWGDVILTQGRRTKGPLFHDESVQKILKTGLHFQDYTDYVKYPRSYHLPWSQGTSDDKTIKNCDQFVGKEVVVTEKMDGENTTIYRDYIHARSLDSGSHWSQSWVRQLQGKIGFEIPEGFRFCGENLYAKHSIGYTNLDSYFYLFSIWDDKNECLSWDEMLDYADILELTTVPVLYRGVWDEKKIQGLWNEKQRDVTEGYVVRVADKFSYQNFSKSLAKFVRSNHVAAENHHWKFTATEKNELKK